MNQKLAYTIFFFAFVVAIVVGFYSPSSEEHPRPAEFREKFQETILNPLKPKPPIKKEETRSPSSENKSTSLIDDFKEEPLSREAFLRKYGDQLKIDVNQGRVTRMDGVAIRTESLNPEQKVKSFRPSHEGDLVMRAKEILADSRKLIGANDKTQFGDPITTPGVSSGQVVFPQTVSNVPLIPGGTVSLLIGPEGELRALDSSVYPDYTVQNSVTLSQPDSSRVVLYVAEAEPKAILHYGFETIVRGVQTITDAQTGTVLYTRDRKVF